MKKFLLGLAALTMTASAFGARMSTTEINGTTPTSVDLPVRLEANIVNGANRLFIEGSAGSAFGDTLILNFGDLARGQIGKTDGEVRVFRGDNWNTNKFEKVALGDAVTFKFIIDGQMTNSEAKINDYKKVEMTNTVVGDTNNPTIKENKFNAGIALLSVTFDKEDMAKSTRVEAKIGALTEKIANTQEEGKYVGTASIVATLGAKAKAARGAGVP